ncbi:MAG: hypothetical protein K0S47_3960 [Herbinix sp.]|jgi:HD superfamily phosphodiesterase|nr:hypothetical protein [Herbinix sp.]
MDLPKIKQLAYDLMGSTKSHEWKEIGNKYYHGLRVAILALKLRSYVLPEDDSHDDILTVAAWFHDISNGKENHAVEGAIKAREILAEYCSEYELNEICKIISVHDDRYSDRAMFSDYTKLHQDADHLDHFGTYDVWMEIVYALHHNDTIPEVIEWFQNTSRKYDKQFHAELNYDISKIIYQEKREFLHSFGDRFSVEATGGIWLEDQLLKTYKA